MEGKTFEPNGFKKRLKSMWKVDLRRTFVSPLFYIIVAACFVMPILILVMTTMMGATESIDHVTGEPVVMETFTNTWQAIGSLGGDGMGMSLTGMCNINMLYFFIAVFVGIFVSEDFRSGYAKNLFTVRAKKTDYVFSKTAIGFLVSVCMLLAFFVGAMLGGAIAKLPFDLGELNVGNIVACMLSKFLLSLVFVGIDVAVSVAAKEKTWLSIVGACCAGMLLFTMIPMITPLNATAMNVVLCLAGGVGFAVGMGAVSNLILNKTSLV